MIKVTITGEGDYYFTKERLYAIAEQKKVLKSEKYTEKGNFLLADFFMDYYNMNWLELYSQKEPIQDCFLELTTSRKKK